MLCSFCFSPLLTTGFLNSDFGRHDPRFRSRINPQEPPTFGRSQLTSRRGFWKGFFGHCFRPGLKSSHGLRHTTSFVLRKLTRINIPSLQGKTFPFTRIHGCHSMITVPVHRKNHGHVVARCHGMSILRDVESFMEVRTLRHLNVQWLMAIRPTPNQLTTLIFGPGARKVNGDSQISHLCIICM